MDQKKVGKSLFKWLSILLAPILLWLMYRNNDWLVLIELIEREVRFDVLLLSLPFGVFGNIVRGLRWHLLAEKVPTKKRSFILATLGCYAINFVLPRAGEIWRCIAVSRKGEEKFSYLLGTIVSERLSDILMILIMGLTILIFSPEVQFLLLNSGVSPKSLSTFSFQEKWIYVLFAAIIFVAVAVIILKKRSPFLHISKIKKQFVEGCRNIIRMSLSRKGLFILYTALIWCSYFLFFYISFFAFSFTSSLSIIDGFIAFVLSCIAIILPVQGGIGPWHFSIIMALGIFGIERGLAANFALIVHTTQTIWTISVGLIAIFALQFVKKKNCSTAVADTYKKKS